MPNSQKGPDAGPLWQCPKCRKKFIIRNIWHSCRIYPLKPLFARPDPQVFRLYKRFESMVRACGPVIIEPRRSSIVLLVRVPTIGCTPLRSYLRISLAFSHPRRHPRFVRVTTYSRRFHAHWLEVHKGSDLDAEVARWIREAYALSAQEC